MRYKMQSLDSYSGTVGLNYHLPHIMYKCPEPHGHRPPSQLQALRAFAAYSTDLEMSSNDLALLTFLRRPCYFASYSPVIGQKSRYTGLTKYLIFLQPQAFCDALYAPNSFSARAVPRTPLGELTTLPQTP